MSPCQFFYRLKPSFSIFHRFLPAPAISSAFLSVILILISHRNSVRAVFSFEIFSSQNRSIFYQIPIIVNIVYIFRHDLHALNSCNSFAKYRSKQFLIRIFSITLIPWIFCVCKILKQVWIVLLSDLITFCSWIFFQLSSDSLLFSSHRYAFVKKFFLILFFS